MSQNKYENKANLRARTSRPILVLSLFLIFIPCSIYAQYYSNGVDNSNLRWRRINTNKFEIVYPDFYEKKAQELASVLDTVHSFVGRSLKVVPPKIPFLLHTNTAYSNGLAVWAPKRIEFWTSTPPTTYAFPWLWQLSIHEWRHASQMQALQSGATKVLTNIFGQHIVGIMLGLYIPMWFMEGDAVVAETSLTPTGRGKTPDFNMHFKAQVLDKGAYNFDKAKQGSMKDFVPNSYNLGYHLVAFGREKYGSDLWGDMLDNVGRNFWKLHFFGNAEKRGVNINQENLYDEMIDNFHKKWKIEDSIYITQKKDIPTKKISKSKDYYTSYYSPERINDSTLLALKNSYFEIPKLVEITPNSEKEIFAPGRILHNYYDSRNDYLLWSEYKRHYRWEHENYADIVEYDAKKKKYKRITNRKRLYNPVYNPKKHDIIAAVEDDSLNCQHIVILNKQTGEIIYKVDNKECVALSYPAWSESGESVFAIRLDENGKSIVKYNLKENTETEILPPSFNNILKLKTYNNMLFFIGGYDDSYQLYSIELDCPNKEIIPYTQSRFGVLDYCFSNNRLIISDYTADGSELVLMPIVEFEPIEQSTSPSYELADTITKQENFIFSKKHIKDTLWQSTKYKGRDHLFNFHSWAPIALNLERQEINLGVSAFSQNLLGTSIFEGGYKLLLNEKKDELFVNYTYNGWYPIIKTNITYRTRNVILDTAIDYNNYSQWSELVADLNIDVPRLWTFNSWNNYFSYSFMYSFRNIFPNYNFFNSSLTLFHTVGIGARWSFTKSMALNDLIPQWGQSLSLKAQRSITKDNAMILSINSSTYFPGAMLNHGLKIDLSFQKNTPTIYYFPNEVAFTRGVYQKFPHNYIGAKANYYLPIAYPDCRLGALLYIKRFSAVGFYDIGLFDKEVISSFGADLLMDFHIIRIEQPLVIGLRAGYIPMYNQFFMNVLFSLNI